MGGGRDKECDGNDRYREAGNESGHLDTPTVL
jgi:hypothetical protein